MNNFNPQKPYCKAAIFTCNCCGNKTDIYSNQEWLDIVKEDICTKCKSAHNKHFDAGIIYRHDLGDEDEDIPLHRQCARLHADKQDCDKCINLAEIHWTEIIVCCHKCDKESMMFTEYTVGKNILLFYEECVDLAKPSYIPIEWIEKNGDKIFVISGTGEKFSSS